MGGRTAVGLVVAAWCGLLAGTHLGVSIAIAALVAAAPAAFLAVRAPDRVGTCALLLAIALAGVARGAGQHALVLCSRHALERGDELVHIEGRIVAPPERESGDPVVIARIEASDPPLPAGTLVRLRLPHGTPVEWSDRMVALARLEAPLSIRNPGGFDALGSADGAALAASGRAFTARAFAARGLDAWPRATLSRWRGAIDRRLERRLDPATRELVIPLLVGDRSGLTPEMSARFRASGLIHLLALSGLHVAWMVAIARGLAAACGLRPAARAWAGALCALGYVGIAGPIPSLVRAAAGELLACAARATSRALDPIQALSLGALIVLAIAPGWAGDLGFQLSCAATLGLVAIGPALEHPLTRGRTIARAFIPTASAQITAMPILLLRFHALSWIAPISNLAAVPISGLLLSAGWLAVGVDLVMPGFARPWFSACEALSWALRAVTDWSSSVPRALVSAGPEPGIVALAVAGALALAMSGPAPRDLAARARPAGRARWIARLLGAWACALALIMTLTAHPLRPPPGRTWIVALDVGQGDAVALGFEDGWWLVDAGPRAPRYDAGEAVVLPFLRWLGVRRLDTFVLTHDDGDHTGGANAVLRGIAVRRTIASVALPHVAGPAARYSAIGVARGVRLRGAPRVTVLWPPPPGDSAARAIEKDNAAGVVLEVGEGMSRALLLADVDSTVEASLEVTPRVALIKVGHHGSGSSSGAAFLARARPLAGVISCGRRNPFGHPDRGALARLRNAGVRLDRTDDAGACWYEAGPGGITRLDWRRGAPLREARIPAPCSSANAAARLPRALP